MNIQVGIVRAPGSVAGWRLKIQDPGGMVYYGGAGSSPPGLPLSELAVITLQDPSLVYSLRFNLWDADGHLTEASDRVYDLTLQEGYTYTHDWNLATLSEAAPAPSFISQVMPFMVVGIVITSFASILGTILKKKIL